MRILLAEDDPMVGTAIQDGLRDSAYAVDWVRSGPATLHAIKCQSYGLLLLDLGLPGMDGLNVLQLVQQSATPLPVIIITARYGLDDRIRGLDSGADDYVLKPFAMVELLARVRAVIRRRDGSASPMLSNGDITLDPGSRSAHSESSGTIALTRREFTLMRALMTRPGAIMSRSELEDAIYGWGEEVESNAVEYLIHSVRKKLGSTAIRNVRGIGWMVPREP